MVRSNKKLVISVVMVASLMAGCQTAQKKNETVSDSFLNEPSDYGSDRTPASGGGPLADLIRLMTEEGNAGKRDAREVYRVLNKSEDAEVARIRKEVGGKFDERNVGSLDKELQAKMVDEISKLSKFRVRFGYNAEYKALAARSAEILRGGSKTGVEDARATGTFRHSGLLSTGSKVTADGKPKVYSKEALERFYTRKVFHDAVLGDPGLFGKTKLVGNELVDDGVASSEQLAARNELIATLKSAREYHELTGRSIITVDTCKNLDEPAMKKYHELLDRHIAAAKEGKICPEVEAWVAANFEASLGREGISAWASAAELSVCNFETPETGAAANKLMSQNHGDLGRRPACE